MANKIQVEITGKDNLSPTLTGVSGKLEGLKAKFASNRESVNKMNMAFEDLAKSSLNASGPLGQVADSLFSFAGAPATMAIAAVAAIGSAFYNLYTEQKRLSQELTKSFDTLEQAFVSIESPLNGFKLGVEQLEKEQGKLNKELAGTAKNLGIIEGVANAFSLFGGAGITAAEYLKRSSANKILEEEAKINKVNQDLIETNQAKINLAISEFKALTDLSKVQKLTEVQEKDLQNAKQILNDKSIAYNATTQLAIRNALGLDEATKKLKETKVDELDLLQKSFEANLLSEKQINRLNILVDKQTEIRDDDTRSLEERLEANAKVAASESFLATQAKNVQDAYEAQLSARISLVNEGVRSENLSTKLAESLGKEEKTLSQLVPLTKEYANQFARVKQLRDAVGKSQLPTTFQDDIILIQNQIARAAAEQTAMTDLVSRGLGTPETIDILKQKLLSLQAVYKATADIVAQSQIAGEMQGIRASLESLNAITYQTQLASEAALLAGDSFSLLFDSINSGGNAFANFANGFKRMLYQMATQKAAMNVAEGFENLARAFGFIGLGNVASAAAAKAAAVSHFKAAALFGAVAGGAGALGGASGGGGGISQSNFGSQEIERPGDVTVIFPEGLLDLTNPATQRQFSRLINEIASNRQVNFVGA